MSIALGLELRRMRQIVIWTALSAVVFCGVVTAFYPTFRDNAKTLGEYMAMFPEELRAMLGMTGSLADPGVLFDVYVGGMLWPIIAAIVAIALATRPVAADLQGGFLELALTTRLSRTRYLVAAIAGQVLALAVLAVATIGGMLLIGSVVEAPFDGPRFALAGLLGLAFGLSIAGMATLLSVLTLDRGRAAGIAAGIVLAMYLLDAAAQVWSGIGSWAGLSFFRHFQTVDLIDHGVFPTSDFLLLLAVATATWAAAIVLFRRRDLAA
jgi:ABC-type transport system involved in multi-copper enzyme maturation permease subunit